MLAVKGTSVIVLIFNAYFLIYRVLVADEATKLQLKVQMEEMSKLTLNLNTAENAKQNLEKKVIRLEEQLQQAAREKVNILFTKLIFK